MSLPIPQYRNSTLSIFIFATLTIYLVFKGEANMFLLIYIYWWDEFIKTLFASYSLIFHKSKIENRPVLVKEIYERYFMLGIYFIFIVIIFGFIMPFSADSLSDVGITFRSIIFMNWDFNFVVLFLFIRELVNHLSRTKEEKITIENLSFAALVVLHVSIILGALLWALASGKFAIFDGVGENADKFIILPFILIKLFFDWINLKVSD